MVRRNEADDKVPCDECGSARVDPNEDGRSLCAICEVKDANDEDDTRTDGGEDVERDQFGKPVEEVEADYRGATDEEVREAIEAAEADDPTIVTDGGRDLAKGDVEEGDTVCVVYEPPRKAHDTQTIHFQVDRVAGGTAAIMAGTDADGNQIRVYRDSTPSITREGTTLGEVTSVEVVDVFTDGGVDRDTVPPTPDANTPPSVAADRQEARRLVWEAIRKANRAELRDAFGAVADVADGATQDPVSVRQAIAPSFVARGGLSQGVGRPWVHNEAPECVGRMVHYHVPADATLDDVVDAVKQAVAPAPGTSFTGP